MKIVAQLLSSLVGLIILATGIFFLLKPGTATQASGLELINNFGSSTARGLIGGSMVTLASFTFYAIFTGKKEYLHVIGMTALSWTIARLISLVADGNDPSTVQGIVLSTVLFAMIVIAFKLWEKAEKTISKQ